MSKILVMGLPGSGKTTLAAELQRQLGADWINADDVRAKFDDWDFSETGRIRQAERMRDLCSESKSKYVIADFVAPTPKARGLFGANWVVWMDTILESRFKDTNDVFEKPSSYDFRVTEKNAVLWASFIAQHIKELRRRPIFDPKKETVQMLGRWQPWHKGHRALFERAVAKTGQVVIQVRDCQGWGNSNPFDFEHVKELIDRDLEPKFQGQYQIQKVPNIVNITYGRKVGYTIEKESFDEGIEEISATKIRENMKVEK